MSSRRIVVKLGTSTLTRGTVYLNRQRILELIQQMAGLHQAGDEIILVSSGAQAAGRERLDFPDLGRSMPAKQMLSAVGQGRLMQIYSEMFDIFGVVVGQVLLTRDDLSHRGRYLNARDTLQTLLESRIIPIINENDTVATTEIRVGDNDNLSAMVASALEADLLIMLTDQPGLFTADPRKDDDARLIEQISQINAETYALAGDPGSTLGTGGMRTKIEAAQIATRSGVVTVIAAGSQPQVITQIAAGERVGTRFEALSSHLEGRKRWLLTDRVQGHVTIDAGAARALLSGGASLLPVGVMTVKGPFERGATLAIFDPHGHEIAHGLSNYNHKEFQQLCGVKSSRIHDILGYSYGDYVIHRNNMVILV
jgi:glutamate 5-kinase